MAISKSQLFTMLLLLFIFQLWFVSPSLQSQSDGCALFFESFSPCLPYLASAPSNASVLVSSPCCDALWRILNSGDIDCLCHLFWQTHPFGITLDLSRIQSLSLVCPARKAIAPKNTRIQLLCSASPTLPPFRCDPPTIELPKFTGSRRGNISAGFAKAPSFCPTAPAQLIDNKPPPPGSDSYGVQEEINITMTVTTTSRSRIPLAVYVMAKLTRSLCVFLVLFMVSVLLLQ